jgi:hypothetical protein
LTDTVPVMYLDFIVERYLSENEVERLAALVGLPISPTDLPSVAIALGVLLTVAELVTDFPLPDDVAAAPVFRP